MKNHEYDDFNVGIDRSTEIFTHLTPFFFGRDWSRSSDQDIDTPLGCG
jgi:hypothetical protein